MSKAYGESIEDLRARLRHPYTRVSVSPGWFGILARLEAALSELDSDYAVRQIKQDRGRLDVYAGTTTVGPDRTRFYTLIREASEEAERTCQECGQPGRRRSARGWLEVTCNAHAPKGS